MNDAIASLLWFAVTTVLVATAVAWARFVFSRDSASDTVAHVIVFSWTSIVGSALFLELFRVLTPYNHILAVLVTCAAVSGWWLVARRSRARPSHARLRLSAQRSSFLYPTSASQLPWSAAWTFLAALGLARSVRAVGAEFPSDWDSLAYHIPLVDHWVRNGSLYAPACAFWYCPGNSELLGYWCVAPFSGDFWVALNNVPPVVLLAVATVRLLACLKVVRSLRHLAGLSVITGSVAWRQMVSNENDVALTALFVACLWYTMRLTVHRRRADVALWAMSFGLLLGIKYVAIGYAAVAGVAVVGILVLRERWNDLGSVSCYGLLGGALLGAYWYVRNYFATGSPLFPKGILGATDLWSLMRPESETSALLYSGRPAVAALLWDAVSAECGWSHLAAFVLLPVTVTSLLLTGTTKALGDFWSNTRFWLVPVVLLSMLVFLCTPNVVETAPGSFNMLLSQYHAVRLGFTTVTIVLLALAVTVSDLCRLFAANRIACDTPELSTPASFPKAVSRSPAIRGLPCALISVGAVSVIVQVFSRVNADATWSTAVKVTVLAALYVSSLGAVYVSSHLRGRVSVRAMLGVAAAVGLTTYVPASQRRAEVWHTHFTDFYVSHFNSDVIRYVNGLSPAEEVICICDYQYYPYIGSQRQYDVRRPLWIPTTEVLVEYVLANNGTIVVTRKNDASAQLRYAAVPRALKAHPEIFQPLIEDDVYLCTRVNRESLKAFVAGVDGR